MLGQADPPLSPEGAARAAQWRLPPDLRALATRGQLGWAVSPLRRAAGIGHAIDRPVREKNHAGA